MIYGADAEMIEDQAAYQNSCKTEIEDMRQFFHERCTGSKLPQTNCLRMCYGWATPIQIEIFKCFPTFVFIIFKGYTVI